MADIEAPEVEYEAANAAIIKQRDKIIRRVRDSKSGGSTAYKTFLDIKTLDKRIALDWVRAWFKKNI
jgi:hypothetical protein